MPKQTSLSELITPCLILDKERVEANILTMQRRMDDMGVALRPHLKTAKSINVADLARKAGGSGITVSTLKEASFFLEAGFRDIIYAVGIVPNKFDQVASLLKSGADLKILTDSLEMAKAVGDYAKANDLSMKTLIEVDCGDNRGGLLPEDPQLIDIANLLADKSLFAGVLTHAGQSYHAKDMDALKQVAVDERNALLNAVEILKKHGHQSSIISLGSTPTARFGENFDGITEVRAGVYVFFDLDQFSRGVCGVDEVALYVLASVIGHNRAAGKILLDTGGLALSKDTSAKEFNANSGYGQLCDLETAKPYDGLYVSGVSQEHGHVKVDDPVWFDRLPVGSMLRIMPVHACMTAAAYDGYHILDGGEVTDWWSRVNGWG